MRLQKKTGGEKPAVRNDGAGDAMSQAQKKSGSKAAALQEKKGAAVLRRYKRETAG